jgi:hypothetical protein
MQQIEIPLCRENWHRLTPWSKKIVLGWLDEGEIVRAETYIAILNNVPPPPQTKSKIYYLDTAPRTFEKSRQEIQTLLENKRGLTLLQVLRWIQNRPDIFEFSELVAEVPGRVMALRTCVRSLHRDKIITWWHPPGEINNKYKRIAGAEPLIQTAIEDLERFVTRRAALKWISASDGKYFSIAELKSDMDGRHSRLIEALIPSLVRRRVLESIRKNGDLANLYRLNPD